MFDTFDGFKEADLIQENQNDERFETDMFADTSVEKVKKYIRGNENCLQNWNGPKVGFARSNLTINKRKAIFIKHQA